MAQHEQLTSPDEQLMQAAFRAGQAAVHEGVVVYDTQRRHRQSPVDVDAGSARDIHAEVAWAFDRRNR